jgi:hypothetical protein
MGALRGSPAGLRPRPLGRIPGPHRSPPRSRDGRPRPRWLWRMRGRRWARADCRQCRSTPVRVRLRLATGPAERHPKGGANAEDSRVRRGSGTGARAPQPKRGASVLRERSIRHLGRGAEGPLPHKRKWIGAVGGMRLPSATREGSTAFFEVLPAGKAHQDTHGRPGGEGGRRASLSGR